MYTYICIIVHKFFKKDRVFPHDDGMIYHNVLKKITLILISVSQRAMPQFKLPIFVLSFLTFFLFFSTIYMIWFLCDYQSLKTQIPKCVQLTTENKQRNKMYLDMAEQIDQLTQEMIMIEENLHKSKIFENPGLSTWHFFDRINRIYGIYL